MILEVVETVSVASGRDNEDRQGAAHELAWVIDGATDVLPEPLTRAPSDAAWLARHMSEVLHQLAADPPHALADLPQIVAERLAPRFAADAHRPPTGPGEHPSAAAIVVRMTGNGALEYVTLGDCVMLVETAGALTRIGIDEETAGDRWVADALRSSTGTGEPLTRHDLLPRLRAQRTMMNAPGGYAIFSITAPPRTMIRRGELPLAEGSRILLATDGLTRLIDVFRRYDTEAFWNAAWSRGLADLASELRALETADAACTRYPRAKISDDATGMLIRVTGSA
ncbi:MAG: protein phosphatase 2C domain-containing protein [Hyphomicrobium sp.]|uniref:protein phosphatase 2C domain-containing protein n=1 Tax=Hyphomicrobium sp. TaxID=82 RepID=UPI003D0CA9CF